MRIAKSNNLSGATAGVEYSIAAGGITGGTINDLVNPDFSYFTVISGTSVKINVAATGGGLTSNYFALHGVRFNAGPNTSIKAQVSSGGVVQATYDLTRPTSLFFTRTESNDSWDVEFFTSGGFAIVVAISFITSGLYSEFPRSGARGGEYMSFYGNNKVTTSTTNQLAQPVVRTQKNVAKQVAIKCPNAPIEYIQDDLQDIFATYNQDTVLSIQMFNDDPLESFAGFDLVDDVRVSGESSASLASLSLTFKGAL